MTMKWPLSSRRPRCCQYLSQCSYLSLAMSRSLATGWCQGAWWLAGANVHGCLSGRRCPVVGRGQGFWPQAGAKVPVGWRGPRCLVIAGDAAARCGAALLSDALLDLAAAHDIRQAIALIDIHNTSLIPDRCTPASFAPCCISANGRMFVTVWL